MDLNYSEIGARIARRRRQLGMKQFEVEEKADISYKYLSNIERGISIPALSRSPARDGKRKSGRTVPPAAALLPQRTAKSAGARPETDRTRLSEPGEAVRHAATPGKGTGATSAS